MTEQSQPEASVSVSAAQISRFLRKAGMLAGEILESPKARGPITAIRSLTDARAGDLAWLTARVLEESPDAVERFQGAYLVAPPRAGKTPPPGAVMALCREPKLAFSLVIAEFFSLLLTEPWPPNKSPTVSQRARIGKNAILHPGSVIGDDVVLANEVVVGPNTCIAHSDIGERTTIGANCSIGLPGFGYAKDDRGAYHRFPHLGRVVVENDVEIGSNTCIDRGGLDDTIIEAGCKIDNLVHIAHNVQVGRNSVVIANSMVGGSVRIGEDAWLAPSTSLMNQIQIGRKATVGLGAVVLRSVDEATTVVGNPARVLRKRNK